MRRPKKLPRHREVQGSRASDGRSLKIFVGLGKKKKKTPQAFSPRKPGNRGLPVRGL